MVIFRPSKGQAQLVFMARVIGVEVRRIAEIMKKIRRRKLVQTFEDLKTSVIFSAIFQGRPAESCADILMFDFTPFYYTSSAPLQFV